MYVSLDRSGAKLLLAFERRKAYRARIKAGKLTLLLAAGSLAWLYTSRLREWQTNWGASKDEVTARLPGDELVEGADVIANRAIRIDAPAADVWPWIVQMGPGRGGAYTYDWVENLFGLGMHSADAIHPEWQQLRLDDTPSVPPGEPPGPHAMRVRMLDPERTLVTASEDGTWAWGFYLFPEDGGTRLLSRNTIKTGSSLGAKIGMALMSPGSLVMERKMLLGIKERAESLAQEPVTAGPPPSF
jgi:hypothetical protein